MSKVRKAILPVAGFGTRVLPATKSIPKEMLPVFDRPAIQYVVDEALQAGIEHIVFVTGRNKSAIEDYFDTAYELEAALAAKGKTKILEQVTMSRPVPGSMSFVRQQAPLGLGHAIWCARDIIGDEPFAILLPDVLIRSRRGCLAQMVDVFNVSGSNVVAVDPVPLDEVNKYGVIDPLPPAGDTVKIRAMVEKPPVDKAPSNLAITGRYILHGEIFRLLEDQAAGAGGEIQLTDAMARLMEEQDFHAVEFEGTPYDCGSKLGYLRATMAFALNHAELGPSAYEELVSFIKSNDST